VQQAEGGPDGDPDSYLVAGTAAYRRAGIAVFAAGFATFATLYCVQPLMPAFAGTFGVSPAVSSLALSSSTGLLAVAMLGAGALSDAVGRKPVMLVALALASLLCAAAAGASDWPALLAMRALEGVALSGLPAVTMAYVGEEIEPRASGAAMGLYIGGTALGGMSGRVLSAVVADALSWRMAMAAVAVMGIVALAVVWLWLPPSRHFRRHPPGMAQFLRIASGHLADSGLCPLFLLGFTLMGSFVTVYNYLAFRLIEPPFGLRPAVVGAIFLVYIVGVVGSPLVGGFAARRGWGRVLPVTVMGMAGGLALMISDRLDVVLAGIALFTFAFFGAHSIASGWIGQRVRHGRAQASAIYLFCYYMGSTVCGTGGGLFWSAWGWDGVSAFVAVLTLAGLILTRRAAASS
jgi:YNFM family putative membrane transporter